MWPISVHWLPSDVQWTLFRWLILVTQMTVLTGFSTSDHKNYYFFYLFSYDIPPKKFAPVGRQLGSHKKAFLSNGSGICSFPSVLRSWTTTFVALCWWLEGSSARVWAIGHWWDLCTSWVKCEFLTGLWILSLDSVVTTTVLFSPWAQPTSYRAWKKTSRKIPQLTRSSDVWGDDGDMTDLNWMNPPSPRPKSGLPQKSTCSLQVILERGEWQCFSYPCYRRQQSSGPFAYPLPGWLPPVMDMGLSLTCTCWVFQVLLPRTVSWTRDTWLVTEIESLFLKGVMHSWGWKWWTSEPEKKVTKIFIIMKEGAIYGRGLGASEVPRNNIYWACFIS